MNKLKDYYIVAIHKDMIKEFPKAILNKFIIIK